MVSIRRISYQDVVDYKTDLMRFLHMNIYENYPEMANEELVNSFYSRLLKYSLDGSAIVLGAFDGEKIVGFHWGHKVVYLGKERMHSAMNGIDLEYRSQRIGSRFFAELERIAKEEGIDEIEAFCRKANDVAVNYHLHNGFEIESYRVVKHI